MSHGKVRLGARLRVGLLAATAAMSAGVLPEAASAAAPTPQSATHCGGSLTRAKATIDDPNLLTYQFNCDYSISSYTLVVNRGLNDDSTVDDFGSTPGVLDTTNTPVATLAFSCSATLPGNGVNCNAGGGALSAPDFVNGTIDTTDPYCSNIPSGSLAGTFPEPTAVVQLVVTDTTGAEDGPFRLRLTGACPVVHVLKAPPKRTSKPRHRRKSHAVARRRIAT